MKKIMFYKRSIKKSVIAFCMVLTVFMITGCDSVQLIMDPNTSNASGEKKVVTDDIEKKLENIQGIIDESFYFDEEYEENVNQTQEYIYKGLMQSLKDPYSIYYTNDEYESMQESTSGEYVGIGVQVQQDAETNLISVIRVFDGPAKEAGVMKEDIITKVNGEEIEEQEVNEVVKKIKGESGTTVTLTIYRGSEKRYIDFEMERRAVENPTVTYEMLENQTGYIIVTDFYEVTAEQFRDAVLDLEKQGMKGLIVDLRDNSGGLLGIVVDMLDFLLPAGKLVYTEDKDGNIIEEYSSTDKEKFSLPLAVLVNEYSASASEIFAGAIKDYGVGTIVGTTTYGKGIVQRIFPLEDGSALKLTIAKYFTPNGNDIHEIGVVPDVEVELDEKLRTKSDIDHKEDNQLQEALKVLKEKM